jgi:uncharacterized protein
VPQDDAEAVKWYRLAADQGDTSGQDNLGSMYENGEGLPKDFAVAYLWPNLAAARETTIYRDTYAAHRDAVAKLLTPDQIVEAQRLAREWNPKT